MNFENDPLSEPVSAIPRKYQQRLNFAPKLGSTKVHNTL